MALFVNKRQFRGQESAQDFLCRARSDEDQAVLGKIIDYTESLLDELVYNVAGDGTNNVDTTCLNADSGQALKSMI